MTGMAQDFVTYGEERPNPETMIENDRVRVIMAGLKPEQRIPVHPEAAAVYHFLEGKGVMTVDEAQFPVQPGTVIVMDEGAQRGLLAETQLVFMAVRLA
jgi:mannose-6-phosphate isomerase-like protein (cupin superfamily)